MSLGVWTFSIWSFLILVEHGHSYIFPDLVEHSHFSIWLNTVIFQFGGTQSFLNLVEYGHFSICISFSSSNTRFYESRIFCLFPFWVFFPDKSFKLISKYTQNSNIARYIKKKNTLCNTLNWGNWNSGFVKLGVRLAERDISLVFLSAELICIQTIKY